jgi:putative zinc finger/helix-turn-helix YgiT family protein
LPEPHLETVAAEVPCPACGRANSVVRQTRREIHKIRGKDIAVDSILRYCTACGAEFEHDSDPDWREAAFAIYRQQAGLLQPEEIRGWRQELRLTQDEIAALLGWGEATLGRYEKGALQTEAHDRQLRDLMAPAGLLERIMHVPDVVPAHKRERLAGQLQHKAVQERLDEALLIAAYEQGPSVWNGQRELDLRRLIAAILILLASGELKTKFNKLMFYADFTHFRQHRHSVTGLHYARADHGPVPDGYATIIAALVEAEVVAVEEVEFPNGYLGERLVPLMKPDPDVLTDIERDTLVRVREYFSQWTATRIRDRSHEEPAWLETSNGNRISYEYADTLKLQIY